MMESLVLLKMYSNEYFLMYISFEYVALAREVSLEMYPY